MCRYVPLAPILEITTMTRARMTTAASSIDPVLRHVFQVSAQIDIGEFNSDYHFMLDLKPHCALCFGLLVSMDRWLLLSVCVSRWRYPGTHLQVPGHHCKEL